MKQRNRIYQDKSILSWALYDWGNSAFATTVMAGFFPIFYKQYWSADVEATVSTFQLGAANSAASILVACMAPMLGAMADCGSARKKFLFFFTFLGVANTASLYLVAQGHWQMAIALYILANIGFSGGVVFYDALLITVADKSKMDAVSALGFSMGYLGGGLLFALNVFMTLKPSTFGLADASEAVRVSFLSVAVWWAIFSIPIFLFVKETETANACLGRHMIPMGFRQLHRTFQKVRKLRVVFIFLAAYWLYIDGVDTIVRMAVDYGMSLGFKPESLISALLVTQFVGFPATILFGKIGEKYGPKKGIYIALSVYILVTVWGFFMQSELEFYALATLIGLVQGGVQALSRSFYTRIIPHNQSAEFFGFYNLLGKFAAVLGPILMGTVGLVTGSTRHSILSICVLFLLGACLLSRVDEDEGRRLADELA